MAENEQRSGNERLPRVLISFPEPGVLQFACANETEALNLYRAIRLCVPEDWFCDSVPAE